MSHTNESRIRYCIVFFGVFFLRVLFKVFVFKDPRLLFYA